MAVFVGPGVRSWAAVGTAGVCWIASPPLNGRPTYPVFLDLVETAWRTVDNCPVLLQRAARALAPDWAELVEMGLEPDRACPPSPADLGATDEAPIIQRFLACGLAQVLSRLPVGFGFLVRCAEMWDLTSLEFLDRLVRESAGTLSVAIETRRLPPRSQLIASWPATAVPVPRPARTRPMRATARDLAMSQSDRILALCPHGLPVATLRAVGGEAPDTAEHFVWPDGQPAVTLTSSYARRVRAEISPRERAQLHAAIFDAHPVAGWNYIRRMGHAVAAGDASRLLQQHVACLAGTAHMGYDFLYCHLDALAIALPPPQAVGAHLAAARLAPRLWGRGGRRKAVRHYRSALSTLAPGEAALRTTHELANLYANMRTPAALRRARRYYRAAWELLATLADPVARTHAEIRLCNGLALVEYHEGRDEAALALERRALDLLADLSPKDEGASRWTEPLIRTNTAKLLIKRFNDFDGGVALLHRLLEHPEVRIQESSAQNLGRACFDKADYAGAVQYLAPRVEGAIAAADLSESEELFDRLVFTLSLVALAEPARAARQLPRLRYLAEMNGAEMAVAIADRLADICATDQRVAC